MDYERKERLKWCCPDPMEPMNVKQALAKTSLVVSLALLSQWLCCAANMAATEPVTLQATITEEQALNATLLSGPRAGAVRAQLGIAKAGIAQAWVLPNPALMTDIGFAELSQRFGVSLPVEAPWKLVLRLIAAKSEISVASIDIERTLWALRADSRRAYTELVVAEESLQMMRDLFELTRLLTDVARKRYQAGDVAKLDVLKAELAYSQAEIEASQAERRVIQAREQLNVIMGRPEDSSLAVPKLSAFQLHAEKNELLPNLTESLPPLSQFIAEALRDRLELKLLNQQIVATRANKRVAVGNIFPDPQVAFGYDRQVNPAPDPNVVKMFLTASLPLPILDRQQGILARLRATLRQLDAQSNAQKNIVRGQVALAYRRLVNARENIRRYQDSVLAQSEKVAELGRLSYKLGQTDITSALTAQQSNIQVRNVYLNEVLNYQQAFTDLEQSVGHILQ